jgi:hypothetical protein
MTREIVQNSAAAAQDDAAATVGVDQCTHRIFDCAGAILGAMLFAPIIHYRRGAMSFRNNLPFFTADWHKATVTRLPE